MIERSRIFFNYDHLTIEEAHDESSFDLNITLEFFRQAKLQ